jgi:hypothetical protein
MRRKLKNFKNKNGHTENGGPRQLLDEAFYREFRASSAGATPRRYDSEYSGWSNPARPLDQAISLRPRGTVPPPG